MCFAFDPVEFVREVEAEALAGGWTINYLSPTESSTRPWLQRRATVGGKAPDFYLSSGIHGDEPAGPLAVLEMLRRPDFFVRFNATIFPILNPNGLVADVRTNLEGIDLNRDYRNSKSDEIKSHVGVLKTLGRFDAAMFLHEDFEGVGAYLYELNEGLPLGVGNQIIESMGRHVPIDLRPEIEEVTATGGVLQRADLLRKLGPIEDRPDWPEAIYISVNHSHVSYTTETPKPFPLADRVAAQVAAVEVLLGAVLGAVGG